MWDIDLAAIYCATTKALNQAVRRNAERIPTEFAFRPELAETVQLRDHQMKAIVDALQSLLQPSPEPPKGRFGFYMPQKHAADKSPQEQHA